MTAPTPTTHRIIWFTVPGIPHGKTAGKHITRKAKSGQLVSGKALNPKDRSWYLRVQHAASTQVPPELLRPIDLPLRLIVVAWWPCARPLKRGTRPAEWKATKPDTKNILAGVEDALEGILFTNDSRLVDSRCLKLYAPQGEPARTEVHLRTVWPIEAEEI